MQSQRVAGIVACLAIGVCLATPVVAQSESPEQAPAFVNAPAASRVAGPVDDSKLVRLAGNTHPAATRGNDKGLADPNTPMEHLQLVLRRSDAQESALERLMASQYQSTSPNYHRWLQPEEFGTTYGPSEPDIRAVTSWLENHGFVVNLVTAGRTAVDFSGTAGLVQRAFHTEIHRYDVNGELHIANATDPLIPAALGPVVLGVLALHDFRNKPLHINGGNFTRGPKEGPWHRAADGFAITPETTVGSGSNTYELVSPHDFATLYDFASSWNLGTDGTGQTIAIAGRSDINLTDVATFRSSFNLPANAPTVIVADTDPGNADADSHFEAMLDVEWSGAAAKGANIIYVVSPSETTAASYIVNHNTAPIMSFSFGNCESNLGSGGNAFWNNLWQQGAAEGITIFVASGDAGAAGCDSYFPATPYESKNGLQISGLASTPYNVAVGGTDFNWINSTTSYWSATNNFSGGSALGYVPEVPWNGSCASDAFDQLLGATALGWDEETACNQFLISNFGAVTDIGGGGGASSIYAKPSWQSALSFVDGHRDIPDVSLFASNGQLHSYWLICDSLDGTVCSATSTQGAGGTSVASPAWAGIMAMMAQSAGGGRQGNVNYSLYALAKYELAGNCAQGTNCSFHDITTGNIASPCVANSPNCTINHTGDTIGILSGYTAGVGYDYATGLGTVDGVYMLKNWKNWSNPTATLTPNTMTFASTAVGATSAAQVVTVKNTGTATLNFTAGGITFTGTNPTSFVESATTCGTTLAASASCTVSVESKPATSGALTAKLSIADNAGGSPQLVTLTGTGTAATQSATLSPATLTFPAQPLNTASAAQTITLKNTGTTTLTAIALTYNQPGGFTAFTACGTTLAAGASCTSTVVFTPTGVGTFTGTFFANDSAGTQTTTYTGVGVSSALTVSLLPSSLTFASTMEGSTSAAQVVTLKNTGTSTVTLTAGGIAFSGTNASSFVKSATTCGTSLAAGASCTISVELAPAAIGALAATLSVGDNATGSPQKVTLTGTGAASTSRVLTFTPASLTFPNTVVGTASEATLVKVTNTGTLATAFTGIAIGGTGAPSFEQLNTCGSTLAAAASCYVYAAFKPAAAGAFTATINFTDNAVASPQKVAISGFGTAAPSVKLSATTLAFPTTLHGTTSAPQALTVTNSGSAILDLTSIVLTGTNPADFVELDGCGTTLAPAASCTVYLAFSPAAAAAYSAKVTITDNGSASPQSATLTGTGK